MAKNTKPGVSKSGTKPVLASKPKKAARSKGGY